MMDEIDALDEADDRFWARVCLIIVVLFVVIVGVILIF